MIRRTENKNRTVRSKSISQCVHGRRTGSFFGNPDHKAVWKAYDGKKRRRNKTLMHAQLVRTAGMENGDFTGFHSNFIIGAVLSGDGKGIAFRNQT